MRSQPSFLDALLETMDVEIVLDNAKSHAKVIPTKKASRFSDRTSRMTKRYQDEEDESRTELDIEDLVKCAPSKEYFHNSFPATDVAPHLGRNDFCRWASSSDSDFAYVKARSSFDRMLKEEYLATDSSLTNVSRPVRRTSLKNSAVFMESEDHYVLNSLCSNVLSVGGMHGLGDA